MKRRHATKADWAEARAKELRTDADALRHRPFHQRRNPAAHRAALSNLEAEAARFAAMAAHYRRTGR